MSILTRWKVKVKVYDRSKRVSSNQKPVYTRVQWFDYEPSPSDITHELEKVMNDDQFKPDHFYGEATSKRVFHTARTQYVAT